MRRNRACSLKIEELGVTKEKVMNMGYNGPDDATLMAGFYVRNHLDYKEHPECKGYYADYDGHVYHLTRQGRVVKVNPVFLNSKDKFYLIVSPFNYAEKKTESMTLHRFVYEAITGKIVPPRMDIHHKDFNPLNNEFFNLMTMDEHEHMKLHGDMRKWMYIQFKK